MSDTSHTSPTGEPRLGPGQVPGQFMLAVFLSFIVPIGILVSLVSYVTAGIGDSPAANLTEKATAARIQKVGELRIVSADRESRAGKQVFEAQCGACHATGLAGAPKFGDAGAWGPRVKSGFDSLLNSAMKGKNAMGAQSGGEFTDFEIARAVVYMANAGGAKFIEPKSPSNASPQAK